jgi:hypothetical protein
MLHTACGNYMDAFMMPQNNFILINSRMLCHGMQGAVLTSTASHTLACEQQAMQTHL